MADQSSCREDPHEILIVRDLRCARCVPDSRGIKTNRGEAVWIVNDNVLYRSQSRRALSAALGMPASEIWHTTSAQPTRMTGFHVQTDRPSGSRTSP